MYKFNVVVFVLKKNLNKTGILFGFVAAEAAAPGHEMRVSYKAEIHCVVEAKLDFV